MSSITTTDICNMALNRIGAKRITDFDTDTSVEAVACQLHYEPTRDAILRGFEWNFASGRATLRKDTNTPDFGYDNQFVLPNDFLRIKSLNDSDTSPGDYVIEGSLLLTDDDEVELLYIKKITDTTKFEPLFVEVLVLELALKLVNPLAGAGLNSERLRNGIIVELRQSLSSARVINKTEINCSGGNYWNDARYSSVTE